MNLETFTSFSGRIPRKTFWLGFLVLMIITWILQIILFSIFGVSMMSAETSADPALAAEEAAQMMSQMALPFGLLILLTLWPSIAIYTKRWHDRDKSGWWSLILFVPIIGSIWMLIELGFLRGTDGPNRFGDDPIAD